MELKGKKIYEFIIKFDRFEECKGVMQSFEIVEETPRTIHMRDFKPGNMFRKPYIITKKYFRDNFGLTKEEAIEKERKRWYKGIDNCIKDFKVVENGK